MIFFQYFTKIFALDKMLDLKGHVIDCVYPFTINGDIEVSCCIT